MAMVSLEQKFEEPKEAEAPSGYFPSVYFDGQMAEDLGLLGQRVGSEVMFVAKARVASVSESKGGGKSVSLELLEGDVSRPARSMEDIAKVMFGGSEES